MAESGQIVPGEASFAPEAEGEENPGSEQDATNNAEQQGETRAAGEDKEATEEEAEEGPIIPESFYERTRPDKHNLLGRVFLLLQCSNGQVLSACDKLEAVASRTHPGFTGLSIVQKDLVACILEAPSEALSGILAAVEALGRGCEEIDFEGKRVGNEEKAKPESDGAWFDNVRVLNFVEGFASMSYSSYMRAEVTPSKGVEVNLNELDLSEFVFEMYTNFVSMGARMRSKRNLRNAKELKQNFPDLIPGYEKLQALLDAELVLSIEEFVQLFHKPFDVQPIEDKTWPMHIVNDDLGGLLYM